MCSLRDEIPAELLEPTRSRRAGRPHTRAPRSWRPSISILARQANADKAAIAEILGKKLLDDRVKKQVNRFVLKK